MSDLGPGELGSEPGPEILEAARPAEDAIDPRPVRGNQTSGMRLAQERPQPARARDKRLEPVPWKIPAGKRRVLGPGRPGHEKMRDLLERCLGEQAIARDLAAVHSEQRRLAIGSIVREQVIPPDVHACPTRLAARPPS